MTLRNAFYFSDFSAIFKKYLCLDVIYGRSSTANEKSCHYRNRQPLNIVFQLLRQA
jgi:hypothetical protein